MFRESVLRFNRREEEKMRRKNGIGFLVSAYEAESPLRSAAAVLMNICARGASRRLEREISPFVRHWRALILVLPARGKLSFIVRMSAEHIMGVKRKQFLLRAE
jgi:hypothetical protein